MDEGGGSGSMVVASKEIICSLPVSYADARQDALIVCLDAAAASNAFLMSSSCLQTNGGRNQHEGG